MFLSTKADVVSAGSSVSDTLYDQLVKHASEVLAEIHDYAVDTTPQLKFDVNGKGWAHIYAVGLFASLVEVSGSCIALARARAYVGIAILARTSLEAFVDLKSLLAKDEYVHNLEVKRCKEWLKILGDANGNENPYLAVISDDKDLDATLKMFKADLARAKAAGGKDLGARDRFVSAGHEQDLILYNFLCTEAHNNGRALLRRHLDTNKDPPELVMYDSEPKFVMSSLSTVSTILLNAVDLMHQQFAREKLDLASLTAKLDQLNERLTRSG